MTSTPAIDAPQKIGFEYVVVPLKEAKNLKKDEDAFIPEQLNELGEEGWEAVGLSLKYGDLMAWPVVLLTRPIREAEGPSRGLSGRQRAEGPLPGSTCATGPLPGPAGSPRWMRRTRI